MQTFVRLCACEWHYLNSLIGILINMQAAAGAEVPTTKLLDLPTDNLRHVLWILGRQGDHRAMCSLQQTCRTFLQLINTDEASWEVLCRWVPGSASRCMHRPAQSSKKCPKSIPNSDRRCALQELGAQDVCRSEEKAYLDLQSWLITMLVCCEL